MKKSLVISAGCSLLFAASVLTNYYSNSRLGTTDPEPGLTPTTVAAPNFGKNCTYPVDGDVYAQPLYVPSITGVTGQSGAVNLLVVATMHGSLYAFNADRCDAFIWRTNFGAGQGASSYPGNLGQLIYNRETGCKGTPAADTSANVVYVVCSTVNAWVMRKANLKTGALLASATITATSGQRGGITFCPLCQQNSAGVTLANGYIYTSFGSMNDQTNLGSWYGWIFAYDASLSQVAFYCTTCGNVSGGGGVWQSGGGMSVDSSGNLYAITGNGSGTVAVDNLNLSVLKLSPTLSLLDWYAPSNYADLNAGDEDLASGRPMLIPGTDLIVFGAKDFNVYSIHGSCLGNIGGANNGCAAPQVFTTGSGAITTHEGVYAGVYVPGLHKAYFPNTNGNIYAFSLSGTTWNETPTVSAATYEFPGAQMMATCTGGASCVIFATAPLSSSALIAAQPAKLLAINPTTLAPTWASTGRDSDAPGTLAKFTIPIAANGNLYMGTLSQTVVRYGPNQVNHLLISH